MEKDDEVSGEGNNYTTHYRALDVRLAKWLSIDPKQFAWDTPYSAMGNNPIIYNDQLGDVRKYSGSTRKARRRIKKQVKERARVDEAWKNEYRSYGFFGKNRKNTLVYDDSRGTIGTPRAPGERRDGNERMVVEATVFEIVFGDGPEQGPYPESNTQFRVWNTDLVRIQGTIRFDGDDPTVNEEKLRNSSDVPTLQTIQNMAQWLNNNPDGELEIRGNFGKQLRTGKTDRTIVKGNTTGLLRTIRRLQIVRARTVRRAVIKQMTGPHKRRRVKAVRGTIGNDNQSITYSTK